jgi:hypothetical protein
MIVIRERMMKRSDRLIYRLIQQSETRLTLGAIVSETDYTPRNVLRIMSRLKQQNLVRAVRIGRSTFYESIS